MRQDRAFQELRAISFEIDINLFAEGSCLVKFGNTQIMCTASIIDKLPPWLKNSGKGWITAEYGMLPRSTNSRTIREATRGKQTGRIGGGGIGASVGSNLASVPYVGWVLAGAATMIGMNQGAEIGGQMATDFADCDP